MALSTESMWDAGYKYAIEAIKILLTLNGGAVIALLTFIGHSPELRNAEMANAILIFGSGALLTPLIFGCAYFAQLHYGNRELPGNPGAKRSREIAVYWHHTTCVLFLISAACFIIGLSLAMSAILKPAVAH